MFEEEDLQDDQILEDFNSLLSNGELSATINREEMEMIGDRMIAEKIVKKGVRD